MHSLTKTRPKRPKIRVLWDKSKKLFINDKTIIKLNENNIWEVLKWNGFTIFLRGRLCFDVGLGFHAICPFPFPARGHWARIPRLLCLVGTLPILIESRADPSKADKKTSCRPGNVFALLCVTHHTGLPRRSDAYSYKLLIMKYK